MSLISIILCASRCFLTSPSSPTDLAPTLVIRSMLPCVLTRSGRAYSSTTIEKGYRTNLPALFTALAVLVFIFTSMAFVLYGWWVERRQSLVFDAAKHPNLVSSLFPSAVRDQLYKGAVNDKKDLHQPSMGTTISSCQNSICRSALQTNSRSEETSHNLCPHQRGSGIGGFPVSPFPVPAFTISAGGWVAIRHSPEHVQIVICEKPMSRRSIRT